METDLQRLIDTLPGLVWPSRQDGKSDLGTRLGQAQRFQFIVEGLPAIIALFTPDGRLAYCNRQMLDYLDETFEQVRSKASAYNFHPDDRDEVLAEWAACTRSGEPFDREARLQRADGVYRWHRTHVIPLRNAAGQIELWYGLSTDIDETKRAEGQLAAETRLLELVARGVTLRETMEALCREVETLAPGWLCSLLLVDRGAGALRVLAGPGLPARYNAILDGRSIQADHGPSSLAVLSGAPVVAEDLSNDGRWAASIWPELTTESGLRSCWSTPILSGGEAVGVFAIYRAEPVGPTTAEQTIVDRFTHIASIAIERAAADAALKAREEELSRAHRFLTEAQQLSSTGSYAWDASTGEETWSDELYRIFDAERGEKISLAMVRRHVHPDDLALVQSVTERAATGEEHDYFFRIITPRGNLKHLHSVAHRTDAVDGRPMFIGAIQDVTQTKLAEEALGRARAELAHVARVSTLSALTASIAHEVNQPLAGIMTNASTCLRMLAADPPNVDGARATAQRTIRDGNRASEVIQRLRALFSKKTPASEPVDLNDAAREVLALSASELQRSQVTLSTDFADDLPAVNGDRVQLQQVVLNLLLNAADAMNVVESRPKEIAVITSRDGAGRVRLAVRDAGVGVAPESVEKLFEAFHTTKPTGMGIGLSISRSIIEGHEGRLWAEPNQGRPGATFMFSIPSAAERTAAERFSAARSGVSEAHNVKRKGAGTGE